MTTYRCTDGLSTRTIEAETAIEAARLYVGPAKAWRANGYDEDAVDIDVTEICHDPSDEFTSHVKVTLDDIYLVGDQYSGQESIRATDAEEAIDEYLDGGDWTPDEGGTVWYTITACDRDGELVAERKVSFDPPEPKCADGHSHDWASPRVSGHGGGVIVHEVCAHCGLSKYTDTWATDPTDGEQGLTSVEYRREDHEES
jgi:hypothetical protein